MTIFFSLASSKMLWILYSFYLILITSSISVVKCIIEVEVLLFCVFNLYSSFSLIRGYDCMWDLYKLLVAKLFKITSFVTKSQKLLHDPSCVKNQFQLSPHCSFRCYKHFIQLFSLHSVVIITTFLHLPVHVNVHIHLWFIVLSCNI